MAHSLPSHQIPVASTNRSTALALPLYAPALRCTLLHTHTHRCFVSVLYAPLYSLIHKHTRAYDVALTWTLNGINVCTDLPYHPYCYGTTYANSILQMFIHERRWRAHAHTPTHPQPSAVYECVCVCSTCAEVCTISHWMRTITFVFSLPLTSSFRIYAGIRCTPAMHKGELISTLFG